MSVRSGVLLLLMVAFVGASFPGCAGSTASSSQVPSTQVPITSVSAVAGKWAGTVRRDPSIDDDWMDLTIKDDGSYEVKSFRTIGAVLGGGRLTVSNGQLVSETERARSTLTLYEGEGKRVLKIDGTLKNGVTFSGWLTPGK